MTERRRAFGPASCSVVLVFASASGLAFAEEGAPAADASPPASPPVAASAEAPLDAPAVEGPVVVVPSVDPPPPPASPCDGDPYSAECASLCVDAPNDGACASVCSNYGGLGFCSKVCENPDVSCLPEYADKDHVCPVFAGPMWRLGARASVGGVFGPSEGPALTGLVVLGRRIDSEWSLLAKVPLVLAGYDGRGSYLLGGGAEFGFEKLFFDAFFANSALAFGAYAGIFAPSFLRDDPFVLGPFGSADLSLITFDGTGEPRYGWFKSRVAFGLEGGAGYDPWSERAFGRAGLTIGIELSAF